jgi:hypothetical protein
MSDDVRRWSFTPHGMAESKDGKWVEIEDYEHLHIRIEELEEALRPLAECDAQPMFPGIDPTQQFIYAPSSNFKETHTITLQDVFNARHALEVSDE